MMNILMVCTANICRSPMAEVVAKQFAQSKGLSKKFTFESAGTHASKSKVAIDSRAVSVLERRGYIVRKKRSRLITSKDFEKFNFIFAMDSANYKELLRICPYELQYKIHMFLANHLENGTQEVPDPYYGNSEGFDRVLDLCEAGVQNILNSMVG